MGTVQGCPLTNENLSFSSFKVFYLLFFSLYQIHIVAGDLSTYANSTGSERQIRAIEKIIVHPEFDVKNLGLNNIAIVLVSLLQLPSKYN